MKRRRWIVALAACGAAVGCASTEPQSPREELMAKLASCTQQFAYDPLRPDLDEMRLAPGEREWRNCAYGVIEHSIMPKAAAPERYRQLVMADRQMTEQIENGTMTRTERRQRLQAMFDEIEASERDRQRQENLERFRETQTRQDEIDRITRIQTQAATTARLGAIRARLR